MAKNYWVKENRRSATDFDFSLVDDGNQEVEAMERKWTSQWRENVLSIVWDRLSDWEKSQPSSVAYTVLKLRSEFPEASSTELAKHLSDATGRTIQPEYTRQLLRRGRVKFVEFLITELADGLEEPSPSILKEELVSLGLYSNVKDLLPKEWN